MNVYDSARMADVLAPLGYTATDRVDDADMVILNTCHIREKASEKVFSELGRLRDLRAERGEPMIMAVAGCVAQAEGAEIMRRAPFVDIVLGPQTYHRLPEMVARAERGAAARRIDKATPGLGVLDTEFPAEVKFDFLPEAHSVPGVAAFLAIQEGCDKFCTYCVVPYTRGAEYSRPVDAVLKEARHLVTLGVRELTLLGQNVNAYHGEGPDGQDWGLGRLVRALAELPGLDRLRYTTSHPRDMDDDLVAAHGDVPALMPFLHLPVQSGSDRILAAMNRQHGVDLYLRLVDKLRAARPDLALSSDFITGYPGETDAEHQATLDLIERVDFAMAFSFKYSPRPGTPAALEENQIAESVKDQRLAEIQTLLNRQADAFNHLTVGRVCDVLFEKPGRHDGQVVGRSPWLQPVHLQAGAAAGSMIGQIRRVHIDAVTSRSLAASLRDTDQTERACA